MYDLNKINLFCESINFDHELSNELYLFFYINRYYKLYDFENCFKIKHFLLFIPNLFILFLSSILLPLFLLFFSRGKLKVNNTNCLYVKKSFNSYKKVNHILPADTYLLDANLSYYFRPSENNLFSQCFIVRLKSFIFTPFITIKNLFQVFIFIFKYLSISDVFEVVSFYKFRLVHFVVYQIYLKYFLNNNDFNIFYTTNKECRFAGLDISICKKYNLQSICVPHGLEYIFKLPAGLPGDKFFCLSEISKNHLIYLYNDTNKFVYDKELVNSIYVHPEVNLSNKKKIIFFTEPRGVFINKLIINGLINSGLCFYVHLHPNDALSNYSEFPVKLFNVSDYPIVGNIVLARKSTVLLEALFNNSISISALIHPYDKDSFSLLPSLQSKLIHKYYDINSLILFLRQL